MQPCRFGVSARQDLLNPSYVAMQTLMLSHDDSWHTVSLDSYCILFVSIALTLEQNHNSYRQASPLSSGGAEPAACNVSEFPLGSALLAAGELKNIDSH